MKPDEIEKAMEKVCKELEQKNPDSENETKAVQDKSDLFGQYVFYHQINENTFREQLKKLDFQVSEKSYRICRMEIANYKEVCEKTKDEQGALIQFLIFNMTEEILGKYKNGELIRENEKNYLLLIEETEEDNQKTKTILKEIARVLREHIMAQVCWKISGVGRSWTELSDRYQECKKNETEKQKEDQKAQNSKQLSIEIYKAKEYIDQHLADKLTLNQVAEIVCLSPPTSSSVSLSHTSTLAAKPCLWRAVNAWMMFSPSHAPSSQYRPLVLLHPRITPSKSSLIPTLYRFFLIRVRME